jgi:hypothetical protein
MGVGLAVLVVVVASWFSARWLSRRVWRVGGFFGGWIAGLACAVALAFGVPWLFEDVHAGQWIVNVMQGGFVASAIAALQGVRYRKAVDDAQDEAPRT